MTSIGVKKWPAPSADWIHYEHAVAKLSPGKRQYRKDRSIFSRVLRIADRVNQPVAKVARQTTMVLGQHRTPISRHTPTIYPAPGEVAPQTQVA